MVVVVVAVKAVVAARPLLLRRRSAVPSSIGTTIDAAVLVMLEMRSMVMDGRTYCRDTLSALLWVRKRAAMLPSLEPPPEAQANRGSAAACLSLRRRRQNEAKTPQNAKVNKASFLTLIFF